MKRPCYPGTDIPVRRGDVVRWHADAEEADVLFVVSTGDFPADWDQASRDWFRTEFGEDIMIKTTSAGLVIESDDCESIKWLRRADGEA